MTDNPTTTRPADPWLDASPRDVARAAFVLGEPLTDPVLLADLLMPEARRVWRSPTIQSLLDSHRAASRKVATEAMRLVRDRLAAYKRKGQKKADWLTRMDARDTERRRNGQPVHDVEPVWERDAIAARLFALRVADVTRVWQAAGFRVPSTSWVQGAGETLEVVTTPNAFDTPRVDTAKSTVWARRQAYSGVRVRRTIVIRTTWRTDVIGRGLDRWRDGGDPTFVVDARPDPDGSDVVLVTYYRQSRGFSLSLDVRRLRRLPDGSWVQASPRARKGAA